MVTVLQPNPNWMQQDYFCEHVWAFDVSQTKHFKKNIHNTFSRQNKKKNSNQIISLRCFILTLKGRKLAYFILIGAAQEIQSEAYE